MTVIRLGGGYDAGCCAICKASFDPKVPTQKTCGRSRCMKLWAEQRSRERHLHDKRTGRQFARQRLETVTSRPPHPILTAFGPVWAAVRLTAGTLGLESAMTHCEQLTAQWADRVMAELVQWACRHRLTEGNDRYLITGGKPLFAHS